MGRSVCGDIALGRGDCRCIDALVGAKACLDPTAVVAHLPLKRELN